MEKKGGVMTDLKRSRGETSDGRLGWLRHFAKTTRPTQASDCKSS
jgi:hypothetical protein